MSKIAHAVCSEDGTKYGVPGDQTGREVRLQDYCDNNWAKVFRAKELNVADKIAQTAEDVCNNNHVGYSQAAGENGRTSLYEQLRLVNWDATRIEKDCNCDCSAMVAACVNAAGIKVSKDMYTGNEVDVIRKTGAFTEYSSDEYTKGGALLKRGDILWKNGHTAVCYKGDSDGLQASAFVDISTGKFLDIIRPYVIADMQRTGILASVTAAQMILESGWGKSELAQKANNCFGMKTGLSGNTWTGGGWDGTSKYRKETSEQRADGTYYTVFADFRKYDCIEDSIRDHSAYLLNAMNGNKKRYEGVQYNQSYIDTIQIIKDGGYATSLKYVDNICRIIRQYELDLWDVNKAATPLVDLSITSITGLIELRLTEYNVEMARELSLMIGKEIYDKILEADGKEANTSYPSVPFTVRVKGGTNYYSDSSGRKINGTIECPGVYTIVARSGNWGKLKSGAGWLDLSKVALNDVNDR